MGWTWPSLHCAGAMDPIRKKKRAALLSVASNTSLIIAKVVVGHAIGSVSIMSEAIHSGVDLIAALIALFAVHAAAKPPDAQHPYGHGKIENLSGAVEAALIGLAGIWIIVEAAEKLMHGGRVEQPILGVLVMAASSAVNYAISVHLFRVAKETQSVALEADAWHLRTDVWTSLGVATSFLAVSAITAMFPKWNIAWIDPVAAIVVATLILKSAWELTRNALGDLLDESLPENERELIQNALRVYPEVLGVHGIRSRKSGPTRFVELHLVVHPETSVLKAHELEHVVANRIREIWSNASLLAHIEPCDRRCPAQCRAGCWVPADANVNAPPSSES